MSPGEVKLGQVVRVTVDGTPRRARVIQCRYRLGVSGAHAVLVRLDDGRIYTRAPQELTAADRPRAGVAVWNAERGWND